ncbi:Potassium voltage-gated channel sub H member 7 [Phlyctochytrium planicorne]|nr:Potassium voltage-gated channel sub H member 7 [Phlyctochytrium planicorne]
MGDHKGAELLKRLRRQQEQLSRLQYETEQILLSALGGPVDSLDAASGKRSSKAAIMDSCLEIVLSDQMPTPEQQQSFANRSTSNFGDRKRGGRKSQIDIAGSSGHSVISDAGSSSGHIFPGARSRRSSSLVPKPFRRQSFQDYTGGVSGELSTQSIRSGIFLHENQVAENEREFKPPDLESGHDFDKAMEDVEEVLENSSTSSDTGDAPDQVDTRFVPFRPSVSSQTAKISMIHPVVNKITQMRDQKKDQAERTASNDGQGGERHIETSGGESGSAHPSLSRLSASQKQQSEQRESATKPPEKEQTEQVPTIIKKSADPAKAEENKSTSSKSTLRKWYLENCHAATYNEFGERFRGTVQRQFHLLHIESLPKNDYFGFHPHSEFVVWWDFCMLLFLIATIIAIPLFISFELKVSFVIASVLFSATMYLDIARKLFTRAPVSPGSVMTMDSKISMTRYLHGRFALDIIGAFPWYFFAMKIAENSTMEFPENFMLVWHGLLPLLGEPLYAQYTWSFFNSVANTFPITGYKPSDTVEQAATIVAVLMGAMLYAALVGTISTFSLGLDTSGRKFKEKLDEVNEFMEERKLSSDVRGRVRKYFKLKYRGKYFDKMSILNELNDSLRQEIAIHNLNDLLARVPFLRREQNDGRDRAFVQRVADVLIPEYYIDGDVIFQQGEPGNDMYFIEHGTVDIIVNGKIVGALTDGAFFGEVALLDQSVRSATIKASSHTTLFRLAKGDFALILNDVRIKQLNFSHHAKFKDVEVKMRQVYEERLERIRKEKEEKAIASQIRNAATIKTE